MHFCLGEGPYLKIYETAFGRLVTKERVFDNQRIHSIKRKFNKKNDLLFLSVFVLHTP